VFYNMVFKNNTLLSISLNAFCSNTIFLLLVAEHCLYNQEISGVVLESVFLLL